LITKVVHRNTSTPQPTLVTEGLKEGSLVFVDRTYVYREVPAFLIGAEYVMLANNDKTTPNYELDITLSDDATLYLLIDNRVGDNAVDTPPALSGVMQWVIDMGFESTYTQIGVDEKGTGTPNGWNTVYMLRVKAGTITLGAQNDGSSRRMYGVAAIGIPRTATAPNPADQATDVPIEAILAWTPGEGVVAHDVYLGQLLDDVANATRSDPRGVLVSQAQEPNTFAGAVLAYGRTYYWRIDEIAPNGSISRGAVWKFQTEPVAYTIPAASIQAAASNWQEGYGPENTINCSGLDEADGHSTKTTDMWQTEATAARPVWIQYSFDKVYKLHQLMVWNYNADLEFLVGMGLKDVTIDYSLDGANWSTLGDFTFLQATSRPGYRPNTTIDLRGINAKYIKITANSTYGFTGRHGLSEIRFLYIPTYPRLPQPASGATDVDTGTTLCFRPGRDAATHQLLIGTDKQQVEAGSAPVIELQANTYRPTGLLLAQTYYWRIIEVNDAEPLPNWAGPVWSFTTQQFYLVDGFESYTDNKQANQTIWQTWVDGYGTTTNGSQVGHANPPFAERTTVHRGWQSMPFYFNNQAGAPVSEATRTFTPAQDWTNGGARYLAIYFQGVQTNTPGRLYVKVNDALIPYDGDTSDLTKPFWIPWIIDLSKVDTDLTDVRTLTIGIDNGGYGMLYIDDIRLHRLEPKLATPGVWIEAENAESITWPMRVYSDRADAFGGSYIATFGDSSSNNPPANGRASFTVRLDAGTYRIIGRVIAPTGNDDSFWVLLDGASTNTKNHVSGWVRWGLDIGDNWHEVPVRSMDDNDQDVLFTVQDGLYNLQIAFREDGALLDGFMITKAQ